MPIASVLGNSVIGEEWERQVRVLEALNRGVSEYFSQLDLKPTVQGVRIRSSCIDERVVKYAANRGIGLRYDAGCGIMFPVTDVLERAEAVAEIHYKMGIEIECPHGGGCGAGAAAFEIDKHLLVEPERFVTSDAYAAWFAEEVQNRLNRRTGKNHKIEIVEPAWVQPAGIHNAIGAFYSEVAEFNPSEGMPPMFVIDGTGRWVPNGRNPEGLRQLRTAIGIAFNPSGHSFGPHRFNEANHRFVIPIVCGNEDGYHQIRRKLESFLRKTFSEALCRCLKIDMLIIPEERREHRHHKKGCECCRPEA